jgi:hypothetical protein
MAERKHNWAWRRLAEAGEAVKQQRRSPRPIELRGDPNLRAPREHVQRSIAPAAERFMALVERVEADDDQCWRWLGGKTFRVDEALITTPARFIYQEATGEKLGAADALYQTCKTLRCVRPAHLEKRKSGHKNNLERFT